MCSVQGNVSTIESGTKLYMSLYPKDSTDGVIRLGNTVPDFGAETTQGPWKSFHKWKKGRWAVLFSHPADFTPVCTTEIASLAQKHKQLIDMDCLVATLSVDPVSSHEKWLEDVVAHTEDDNIKVNFPIIADANRDISTAYGMIDPWTSDRQELPLTIRCVFIINPENKLMLSLNYPACVGRNMTEIVRCVAALQLSYQKSIATPANWPHNHSRIALKDGTYTSDYKGSVFLLPTVSDEEAVANYPDYHTCNVPSGIPYLRLVKAEHVMPAGDCCASSSVSGSDVNGSVRSSSKKQGSTKLLSKMEQSLRRGESGLRSKKKNRMKRIIAWLQQKY